VVHHSKDNDAGEIRILD